MAQKFWIIKVASFKVSIPDRVGVKTEFFIQTFRKLALSFLNTDRESLSRRPCEFQRYRIGADLCGAYLGTHTYCLTYVMTTRNRSTWQGYKITSLKKLSEFKKFAEIGQYRKKKLIDTFTRIFI